MWCPDDKDPWPAVTNGYQAFYEYWRDRPFPFSDIFPYKLHLGCDKDGHPLLPLREPKTSGATILVTQAYADTFQRIWQFREAGSAHQGIVLTGQPGIGASRSPTPITHRRVFLGKTTFERYALVRLITAQQVVVLCDERNIHLFFGGQVYSRPTALGFEDLPNRRTNTYSLWALIDVDHRTQGPPLSRTSNVWPVQASFPDPQRWRLWVKQFRGVEWGMPLWNPEELVEGYAQASMPPTSAD